MELKFEDGEVLKDGRIKFDQVIQVTKRYIPNVSRHLYIIRRRKHTLEKLRKN
jgi:hypothetical protein